METVSIYNDGIISANDVIKESQGNFIEANTKKVTLEHLKEDCIIPVFSKDNETTISHFEFINAIDASIRESYPQRAILKPDIRVSHVIKGRVPSAIGKPAKELLDHEKTIYYERMAFMFELPEITQEINGNILSLSVGGVRAYNQENLYSKKSVERFKIFIGFKNMVCCNLCVSSDGFTNELRVSSVHDLMEKSFELFQGYNAERHMESMQLLSNYHLSEQQFAQLMGKLKMYGFLESKSKKGMLSVDINDGQVNTVIKNYYQDENFSREQNGDITLWNLYNLFTEANKSSYIHKNLERNVNAFDLSMDIAESLQKGQANWFIN